MNWIKIKIILFLVDLVDLVDLVELDSDVIVIDQAMQSMVEMR
jgi:hypothetical protein